MKNCTNNTTIYSLLLISLSFMSCSMVFGDPQSILVYTGDDEVHEVPRELLEGSEFFRGIEGWESEDPFPLPFISKAELELLIAVKNKIDKADQGKIKRADGNYMAQRIQPLIGTVLENKSREFLGNFLVGIEGFDNVRYITNGVIRVFISKFLSQNRTATLDDVMRSVYSGEEGVDYSKKDLRPLFEKQYALLTFGTVPAEELSIADYIEISGMPRITEWSGGGHKEEAIRVQKLYLRGVKLTSLEGIEQIPGYESILWLDLQENYLTSLSQADFSGLTNLTKLDLGWNYLQNLPAGVFRNLTNLRVLNLFFNKLTTLPAQVFLGLRSLVRLVLTSNRLKELPSGVFDNLDSLKRLELARNKLSKLPSDIFSPLKDLKQLAIWNNPITGLMTKEAFLKQYGLDDEVVVYTPPVRKIYS